MFAIELSERTEKNKTALNNFMNTFCISASKNCLESGRRFETVIKKYYSWLQQVVLTSGDSGRGQNYLQHHSLPRIRGRPAKLFLEVCDKTKRRNWPMKFNQKAKKNCV